VTISRPSDGEPPLPDAVLESLKAVMDPELGDNVVDLGMIRSVEVKPSGRVRVSVALTIAGCPLRTQIEQDVIGRVGSMAGVTSVDVVMGAMDAPWP
jgi:ATP-binding protein involved in chromosome partitioning